MQNERLMYSQMQSFMYGEGVLARSANSRHLSKGASLKRLDLLRSPIFLFALGALVANDWALKPLFHNALTGKLSDFAGLAAFTLFLCSLWRNRRLAIALGVSAAFTLWKSSYAQVLIDAANNWLPFHMSRTVDYTDLVALPAVWMCCAYANRLTLLPMRTLQVWFIATFSLVAFTATSAPRRESVRLMAQIGTTAQTSPVSEREASIQRMLDALAQAYRMQCTTCKRLAMGRVYKNDSSPDGSGLALYASYDSTKSALLYEIKWDIKSGAKEAATLRAKLTQVLRNEFPFVDIRSAAYPSSTEESKIDVARKDGAPVKDDKENQAAYQAALPIVAHIATEAGLEKESEYSFSAGTLLGMSGERELNVTVYPFGPQIVVYCRTLSCKPQVAPLAQSIESALKQQFGASRVFRK